MKVWSTGEQVLAADLNNNFKSTSGVSSFTTNTTITHGLGVSPSKIRIQGFACSLNGAYRAFSYEGIAIIAAGTITSSCAHCLTTDQIEGTPTNGTNTTTTTGRVGLFGFQGAAYITLSAVSSTSFTLTITAGSESVSFNNVIWECYP